MGASVTDILEKVFSLTSRVDELMSSVERMDGLLRDHHERIVRLEGNGHLVAEQAKNASLSAVMQTTNGMFREIMGLQTRIERLESQGNNGANQPVLPKPTEAQLTHAGGDGGGTND